MKDWTKKELKPWGKDRVIVYELQIPRYNDLAGRMVADSYKVRVEQFTNQRKLAKETSRLYPAPANWFVRASRNDADVLKERWFDTKKQADTFAKKWIKEHPFEVCCDL